MPPESLCNGTIWIIVISIEFNKMFNILLKNTKVQQLPKNLKLQIYKRDKKNPTQLFTVL